MPKYMTGGSGTDAGTPQTVINIRKVRTPTATLVGEKVDVGIKNPKEIDGHFGRSSYH